MAKRTLPTEADYVAIAINPALVMVMVTSLVWFLLEIFYSGQQGARLQWSLTMFVVIIVGTARIAMEEGWEKAGIYGPVGAVAVWLAMQKFMAVYGGQGPVQSNGLINAAIMAVIWVTAHMLTWDSTWVDEKTELPDEGLLQAAGIDKHAIAASPAERAGKSWWRRWLERMRRPHAPGLWVVYYSLGALPIFGLGQMLIPARDAGRRQYVFVLCTVYVAAALALLVSTSFLGLRRYLRQRGMQMPLAMVGTWIATGGVLIATVMLLAMLLPRPSPEFEISELPFRLASPSDIQPNRHAVGNDGVEPNDDVPDAATTPGKADQQQEPIGSGEGSRPQPNGGNDPSGQAPDRPGRAGSGQSPGRSGEQDSSDSSGQQPQAESDEAKQTGHADQTEGSGERPPNKQPPDEADREIERRQARGESVARLGGALERRRVSKAPAGSLLFTIFKWGLYLALIAAAVLAIWYNRHRIGQFFSELVQSWRDFWRKLFDWREPEEVAAGEAPAKRRRPTFGRYRDPFRTGKYRAANVADLVRYSYEALEAWAADAGLARRPDETTHEFARRLGEAAPPLAAPARAAADLYSRVHYGGRSLPGSAMDDLELLWQALSAQSPEYIRLGLAAQSGKSSATTAPSSPLPLSPSQSSS